MKDPMLAPALFLGLLAVAMATALAVPFLDPPPLQVHVHVPGPVWLSTADPRDEPPRISCAGTLCGPGGAAHVQLIRQ